MKNLFFTFLLFFTASIVQKTLAQSAIKAIPSPLAMVTYKYGDTYIKITYGRPAKRNRVIFGELVPYGKVWRTGANEASEITVTRDIKIADKEVKAGTYAFFTIPDKEQWSIILNNDVGQWGAFKYDEAKDYVRLPAPASEMNTTYEAFTMEFDTVDPKAGRINLLLKWDKTKVVIPMELSASSTPK